MVSELSEFNANSGTQGINTVMRVVGSKDDVDGIDVEKHHGKQARPTFFITPKAAGVFKGWMETVGIKFSGKGADLESGIGKCFWGNIRSMKNDEGYTDHNLLSFHKASEDDKKIAAKYVAEWTGEDKPPSELGSGVSVPKKKTDSVGGGNTENKNDDEGFHDDDLPF